MSFGLIFAAGGVRHQINLSMIGNGVPIYQTGLLRGNRRQVIQFHGEVGHDSQR